MRSIPLVMYRSVSNHPYISARPLVRHDEPCFLDREKLQTSLERFFRRLPVDKLVVRNNYFFQVVKPEEDRNATSKATPNEYTDLDPEELAWSSTVVGPEDDFNSGHGATSRQTPLVSPSTIRLRTERQTLRRLPKSGAILFTVRTYMFPVTELAKERGVPA